MNIDFAKYADGLVPTIVQDAATGDVLMLGFMNAEALRETEAGGRVTFYSRSKQRLWTKGETSGNFLDVVSITPDCDNDTLLITARPNGPVCHAGSDTCFGDTESSLAFLTELESVITSRATQPVEGSYISKLFAKGLNKIAQKVGEEAVETIIAAKDDDLDAFKNEAADLLFHYLILLRAKGVNLGDVTTTLKARRR
ncbi:MAG TPA: bifunctional phosphoribosyl-AMP cyclohydrolase/phosphoribosyl-ATP diphosphatase HisIE [Pyrinomonadaceae bacterium]|nr:bifunctional phosphoribosyl-AMP cyclohydrolase/phosphoribosyl-ATP diphosphatase HisIE [Pyrinomonadaceae bacterium]